MDEYLHISMLGELLTRKDSTCLFETEKLWIFTVNTQECFERHGS